MRLRRLDTQVGELGSRESVEEEEVEEEEEEEAEEEEEVEEEEGGGPGANKDIGMEAVGGATQEEVEE